VVPGENGWLFDPKDRASLDQSLGLALATRPNQLRAMGALSRAAAHKRWESRPAIERFVASIGCGR
jgi:hypothetical protein